MKKKKLDLDYTIFLIISGAVILGFFTAVVVLNILPNYQNNYGSLMDAKITNVTYNDGKITIETTGDAESFCIKSTKSRPNAQNICWQDIENNTATISVFPYKRYYVWIKDSSGNISDYVVIKGK